MRLQTTQTIKMIIQQSADYRLDVEIDPVPQLGNEPEVFRLTFARALGMTASYEEYYVTQDEIDLLISLLSNRQNECH